ncbi:FAD-dependent monooxygenase [Nocardia sp. bgisy134]|uniref:FAD-dependent monooxygenase n=1 Tax=Nocardia sp. bgisy134 TaxID=3413789 RepID=UPI003D7296EF
MIVIRTINTDVLVVGCGPTGLTAAVSLASQGISTLAISRYPGTAHTPRAHITNLRTMEVFRDLGIESQIKEVGYSLSWLNNNVLATSLAGMEIARYKSYGTSWDRLSDYAAASPCDAVNCPQHVMEPVLLAAAQDRGADVRFSTELVDIEQTPDEVRARVRRRDTGTEYMVRARYVIAADGARSTIAEKLGFDFEGQAGLRGMANSWIEVDLTKYVDYRPGVLFWIAQPGHEQWFGTATLTNVRPWNEWMLVHPWNSDGLPSEAEVIEKARLVIGDPKLDIKVKAITQWQVNNVVATEYRKGRIFLAGDAAHRHPPTGGLGTNTSVQDAWNLAWKLAWVITGKAGEGLLNSYEPERQPVGSQVVARAIKSWHNMADLVAALGFAEGQSMEEGWNVLYELYEDSAKATERRKTLAKALELQNYRSNALGVELGYRYESSSVVDDGIPFPEPQRDPELHYERTTHPGAYLPHAWVEHEQKQVSTLDLVGHGRFSLIVGIGGEPWIRAAAEVGAALGIELPVYSIGLRCEYDDIVGDWVAIREVGDQGAILVRPDRHIAWRSMGLRDKPAEELRTALDHVLAR